jgi:hypothetical protein
MLDNLLIVVIGAIAVLSLFVVVGLIAEAKGWN